jgi:DNA modification methylase
MWAQYKRIIKDNGAIILTASQPFTSALVMSNLKMFKYEWVWDKGCGSNFASVKYQPFKEHENILVFSKNKTTYNPQRISRSDYSLKCHPKGKERFMPPTKETQTNKIKKIIGKLTKDGLRSPKSIIEIKLPRGKMTNKFFHPTQKPVSLGQYLIRTYTNEGDLILDNTCGSGSFLVAAMLEKRNFIGIELDENYCAIAKKRLEYMQKDIYSKLSF